jgi:hypothetical protein
MRLPYVVQAALWLGLGATLGVVATPSGQEEATAPTTSTTRRATTTTLDDFRLMYARSEAARICSDEAAASLDSFPTAADVAPVVETVVARFDDLAGTGEPRIDAAGVEGCREGAANYFSRLPPTTPTSLDKSRNLALQALCESQSDRPCVFDRRFDRWTPE